MNLALLIGRFPPGVGGAELQAAEWAARLARRHHVTVITRRLPANLPACERRDGYDVRRTPVVPVPGLRTVLDLRACAAVVDGLDPRPDLLLCFQTFVSGWIGVRLQRRYGIPALVWVRGEDELRVTGSARGRQSPGVWREATGVLVQSETQRTALLAAARARDPGLARDVEGKLAVVPNGVVLPPAVTPPGQAVLGVGRLIADKGWHDLIAALAGRGIPLVLAGIGPERAALETLARARQVDVRFQGFVGRERLGALLEGARCVVLPSRRGEGFPNVVLEAMAHGRAPVVTPVSGGGTLVRDGEDGVVVRSGDVRALGEAVERLTRDPALAARLGATARAT
ncbi:MAG TPA: glycosyltransferase family 4 protein, partial [Candidatus Eisenbacteria bacterium]|nr:glycosyltransferase family 4 protein [Candidatus Eisenbacteria bacterium]